MATYLYRLGQFVTHHARAVLAAWLIALLAIAGAAVGLGGQLQDNFEIPGAESQTGLDVLAERFPAASGTQAQIVFSTSDGSPVTEDRRAIAATLKQVADLEHVTGVTDPFAKATPTVSANGRYALAIVQFDAERTQLADGTLAAVEKTATSGAAEGGLSVHLGGDAWTASAVHVSATEGIGVVIALIVLVITLGSVLAAGLPIVTALLGIGVSMAAIVAMAALTDISTTTPALALMIGLAVGIDYALFIVARHRHQLALGMGVTESVARALGTAGSAVVFAGATVIIALCGLFVAGIPFLTVMGLAAACAVLVAVLIALSAVPALLTLAGERLRPSVGSKAWRREQPATEQTKPTLGARWVRRVAKAPALVLVVGVIALAIIAIPAKDLALGLNDNGNASAGSTERVTYDLVSQNYGEGFNAPLMITADTPAGTTPQEAATLAATLGASLTGYDGVAGVALATPNPTGDLVVVQVVPSTSQSDPATAELVQQIRDDRAALEQGAGVDHLRVTGQTAVAIDVSDKLSAAIVPFGLVVVGLSLVLLTLVFRSVAVPIKASLGYLLSVGAAFGATTAVFEWGWLAEAIDVSKVGPVISFMPIMVMGVLFGLAMDYEVFLVSRMREHYVHTGNAPEAVTSGFANSARVVTAAALIMFAVFAAFVPAGDAIIKPMAFALAIGVFVDAFVVRMTLVPAAMFLLGDKAWWLPRWLEVRLPHVDIEGESLESVELTPGEAVRA